MRRLIRQIDNAIPLIAQLGPLHGPPTPRRIGVKKYAPAGYEVDRLVEPPHHTWWTYERGPWRNKYGHTIDPIHRMAQHVAWMRDKIREIHEVLGNTQCTWNAVHDNQVAAAPGGRSGSNPGRGVSITPVASSVRWITVPVIRAVKKWSGS